MAIRTQDAVFRLKHLVVDGSFMSGVYFVVRTSKGRMLYVSFETQNVDPHNGWGWSMIRGQCSRPGNDVGKFVMAPHEKHECDEMRLEVDMATFYLQTPEWKFKITSQPVYGRMSGPHHRLDVTTTLLADENVLKPHGLLGQSFDGDDRPRHGRLDVYPSRDVPGNFTTTAMAEGAIDGVAKDYALASPRSTAFRYSRFDGQRFAPGKTVSHGKGIVRATDDGYDTYPSPQKEEFDRRRLSEVCVCEVPPSPPPIACASAETCHYEWYGADHAGVSDYESDPNSVSRYTFHLLPVVESAMTEAGYANQCQAAGYRPAHCGGQTYSSNPSFTCFASSYNSLGVYLHRYGGCSIQGTLLDLAGWQNDFHSASDAPAVTFYHCNNDPHPKWAPSMALSRYRPLCVSVPSNTVSPPAPPQPPPSPPPLPSRFHNIGQSNVYPQDTYSYELSRAYNNIMVFDWCCSLDLNAYFFNEEDCKGGTIGPLPNGHNVYPAHTIHWPVDTPGTYFIGSTQHGKCFQVEITFVNAPPPPPPPPPTCVETTIDDHLCVSSLHSVLNVCSYDSCTASKCRGLCADTTGCVAYAANSPDYNNFCRLCSQADYDARSSHEQWQIHTVC